MAGTVKSLGLCEICRAYKATWHYALSIGGNGDVIPVFYKIDKRYGRQRIRVCEKCKLIIEIISAEYLKHSRTA